MEIFLFLQTVGMMTVAITQQALAVTMAAVTQVQDLIVVLVAVALLAIKLFTEG